MPEIINRAAKLCPQTQANRKVPNFDCSKGQGHTGGHIDSATGKVWGTPKLPYGMAKKWARKKYNR
jgi:hypothetical protein